MEGVDVEAVDNFSWHPERERADLSRQVAGFPVIALTERYLSSGICYPYSGDDVAWRHKALFGSWVR